jgi:hypothetical protein
MVGTGQFSRVARGGGASAANHLQGHDDLRLMQGFLFEPEAMARTELQDAITRLDFRAAVHRLEEFRRLWPEAKLSWEPGLIQTGLRLERVPMNLDSGYDSWQDLQARLDALEVPRALTASIKRNFFFRLLAANRKLFEEPRSAAGRSLGDFHILAGQPQSARRRYEDEVRRLGDGWTLRLKLGNCDFLLGHGPVAHSNYHWSFILGLPEDHWTSIEDSAFLTRLRSTEETEWAFPEMCAAGELPSIRFSSRNEFEGFKLRFAGAFSEAAASRRFCLHWIVSENKLFCSDNELLDARRKLKALHPRLHAQYMQRLAQTS